MTDILVVANIFFLIAILILLVLLWRRKPVPDWSPLDGRFESLSKSQERTERLLREEIAQNREESSSSARQTREEMDRKLGGFGDSLQTRLAEIARLQQDQLGRFSEQLSTLTQSNEQKLEKMRETVELRLGLLQTENGKRLDQMREEAGHNGKRQRDEIAASLKGFNDSILKGMGEMAGGQKHQLEAFALQLGKLTESNETKLEALRQAVDGKLKQIQEDNARQLDQMRATVDEKLQGTLEKRLAACRT